MSASTTGVPTIRLPYPHAGQQAVLRSPARFKWVSAGRRWRKTTMALHPVVTAALAQHEVIWGAPTYDQVRTGWEELRRAASGVVDFRESRMEAVFPGGGRVLYRSLDDPNNARSKTADGFVMDEAAFCPPAAWHEVIRPILADTGGWALLMSTPRGRNWFWREWMAAGDQRDAARWQVPTLGVTVAGGKIVRQPHPLENPSFPFEELAMLYLTTPERVFREEYLAEFVEDGGGVFRRVLEAVGETSQAEGHWPGQYVFGVDWGKYQDFTAIAVVDAHIGALVALDRFNMIDYPVQADRLKALYARFVGPDPTRPLVLSIVAERNTGEAVMDQLMREGLPIQPFYTTNESKRQVIEALALAFERGTIRIPNDPVLLAELQAYETERLPSGLLRYNAPEGMHDDCVIALALAWSGAAPASFGDAPFILGPERVTAEVPW